MKNNLDLNFKVSEEMLRKFLFVCEKEKRAPNAQFALMVRNHIAYYEKTKGRISNTELMQIDISEYDEK